MLARLTRRNEQKGRVMFFSYLTKDATVLGDDARLRQVASNLLANALAHTPPGTYVGVRVVGTDPRVVRLIVEDHGAGLSEEDRRHVFEPFYRVDASRTRSNGGAGLGLAIVAAIIRAHGGTVSVGATVAEGEIGARFVVQLPRTSAERGPGVDDETPGSTEAKHVRGNEGTA
jgi:signal transduction histidine kinase